ncbi:abnormal cell migration protein 13-like [Anneissia japonica]|uniref:abnormal cell migration protein 13-like n=1 Tax=Anneissia japonica TaxID=1529436 RepID=UPI0014255DE1|nr:abnormal cell migration protein 13-like [Anneissia japonica]
MPVPKKILTELLIIIISALALVESTTDADKVYIQDANCEHVRNITKTSAIISSHRSVTEKPYHMSKDCIILISAPPGQQINLRFEFFDLHPSFDKESSNCNPISGDKLMIYESGDMTKKDFFSQPADKTYCGGTGKFPNDYKSSTNAIAVRFFSDGVESKKDFGFIFTYTTFKTEESSDCFMCSDGTMCITSDVVCDDIENCNDDSDENPDICSAEKKNIIQEWIDWLGVEVVIVIAAALGLVLIVMIITCFVCCCGCCTRKEKRDSKPYRAPPTPRPTSFPSQSNFSSYSSNSAGPGRYFPPPNMYPPIQNGGYSVVYNHDNGKVDFPQKL